MHPSGSLPVRLLAFASLALIAMPVVVSAADDVIPHAQDKPPGPPKSPQEALAAMTVPDGFQVELVAAEPDLLNPVAMTIDEKGRFWVCESIEYPRHELGPGRDRVKILEDTDGDGKIDKTSIFADGLNIPSGIAVGYGGVWVANSPDILFLQDTDGDGKADTREVVVTGFGRFDTHELPSSLTWGPDGWLYGLNGVFNPAKVEQNGKTFAFTCAVWRIHPVTREFQVWCEGTSNPWGIAFDPQGNLFVSACVIDHFWHLTETGYYQRQAGAYPPHTWVLDSIVDYKHQKAAYCGLHYADSDAFPPEWRGVFFMGNIHGNCLNTDVVSRRGSTYAGKPKPDFLSANDAWFMPVEQLTGPDGSLYVLDWYDRYHCYQDANRDPKGIDRLRGRLYRVRYKETPHTPAGFDLAKEDDGQLLERLDGGNDFLRSTARRLLSERLMGRLPKERTGDEFVPPDYARLRDILWRTVLNGPSDEAKRNAFWALLSGGAVEDFMLMTLLDGEDATLRAWAVRAVGNLAAEPRDGKGSSRVAEGDLSGKVLHLVDDPSPDVRLQVAIAAPKLKADATEALLLVLRNAGDDPLIPAIVWQNLKPTLEERSDRFLAAVEAIGPDQPTAVNAVLPRVAEWLLASGHPQPKAIARVLSLLTRGEKPDFTTARRIVRGLIARIVTGQSGRDHDETRALYEAFASLAAYQQDPKHPLYRDAWLLFGALGVRSGQVQTERLLLDGDSDPDTRLLAAEVLAKSEPAEAASYVRQRLLTAKGDSTEFRGKLISVLGRVDQPSVSEELLFVYDRLEPELRPRVIEVLVQRPRSAFALAAAVRDGKISKGDLNINQIRRLLGHKDKSVSQTATAIWGTVREGRSPEREKVIAEVRKRLASTPADPRAGQAVFARVCGQCHKIYGQGEDVGPDITRNGRNDYDQLLSNVLDPSLVIGAGYQARTVVTKDGRVLAGLVVEDTPQRLVLKLQGGKTEAIPRSEIEEDSVSPVSLMPEGLERQLTPQELADLFAFLSLDKPPGDPEAKRLSGAPAPKGK
jgi:putative membrane-bound dehydrogenase-like protein